MAADRSVADIGTLLSMLGPVSCPGLSPSPVSLDLRGRGPGERAMRDNGVGPPMDVRFRGGRGSVRAAGRSPARPRPRRDTAFGSGGASLARRGLGVPPAEITINTGGLKTCENNGPDGR